MQNNNMVSIGIAVVVGVLAGFLIWGSDYSKPGASSNRHMMPDGTMMHGSMDMTAMMADMNAALAGKTGDEFDRAFLTEMIVHHEGAVEMAQLALTNAKRQEIKDLSQAIISAQNTEIAQMKGWLDRWYSR